MINQISDTLHIPCPGCCASVPLVDGQTFKPYIGTCEGCWRIYTNVLSHQLEEYEEHKEYHRILVDAYSVQHPGTPSLQSIQSVNVHLIGLCAMLEKNATGAQATHAMRMVLHHKRDFRWLKPPSFQSRLSITSIQLDSDIEQMHKSIVMWAKDVWSAWSAHHNTVHKLYDLAMEQE